MANGTPVAPLTLAEQAAGLAALRDYVNTIVVDGFQVGGYISDDQCAAGANAVVAAVDAVRAKAGK